MLIDGVVQTGAAQGGNTASWELDEFFLGFNGLVRWYMTWDEDSLYLGRIGGNNAEGSVVYLKADYPGAGFAQQGREYDLLRPDLGPMGGVNFAAYMKLGYAEYRTYDTTWSDKDSLTLKPKYSIQIGNAHMEVAIPWDAVTNGNGKPSNLRAVFYQVTPVSSAGCPGGGPFVYGESPWGTGLPNDGPSIGVNDGVPTSPRQPGGCDVGDSTAHRWWGCYPVIGGIGANSWVAPQADAGPDSPLCETATGFILQANTPTGTLQGTWTVVSQPAGSPPVAFLDPNDPNTIAQNLTALGDYVFEWNISNGGCGSMPDTVIITRLVIPPAANAGPDQDLACGLDFTTLTGDSLVAGVAGLWTLSSGQGTILQPDSAITTVTNLGFGPNTFTWTTTNGSCPATSDDVIIWRYQSPVAEAGLTQELCEALVSTTDGNDPNAFPGTPSGAWSQVTGPTVVFFSDFTDPTTTIANLVPGNTYLLQWTVSNGTCPDATDTVRVTSFQRPIADAGGNQALCYTESLQLFAQDPQIAAPGSEGLWSQLSGPATATILDSSLYNSTLSDLEPGLYKFLWEVSNGSCPLETSTTIIELVELQDGGIASQTDASLGGFDGAFTLNPPLGGGIPYMYSLDGGPFQTNPEFSGLAADVYTITIQDANGCEIEVSVEIIEEAVLPTPDTVQIVVPTGFSPNGDNVNDFWEISGIKEYPNATVEVYNAWGGLVFRSVGYDSAWNGTFNGSDLPVANYYFILDPRDSRQEIQKGSLTIFR